MIAKVTKGRAFASLARYLETGNADRVAWTETRNLSTDDPHTASRLMQMTAERSARAEKPVYHIALSFDPHDADRKSVV